MEIGQCADAGGTLRDDAVETLGEREQQPHVRIVAEDDEHLRGGVGRCVRAVVKLRSMSVPPTSSFSATNCSGVIVPVCSADNPYWIPTFAYGLRAKPSCGRKPQIADW